MGVTGPVEGDAECGLDIGTVEVGSDAVVVDTFWATVGYVEYAALFYSIISSHFLK